jgi:hypothetical protein
MKLTFFNVTFWTIVFSYLTHSQTAHSAVTLNNGGVTKLEVVARDAAISFPANQIEDLFPASLPYDQSHVATIGSSNSQAEYHLSQTAFTIASVGSRAGSLDSRSNVQPNIFFSVSSNTPYSLTGMFNVNDPGNSGKYVGLEVMLSDVDTAAVLFHNNQESFGVVDQVFTLGGTSGNQNNLLTGSLVGTLTGGHRYKLYYGSSIYAANSGDLASATGAFQLSFVPEPTSAALALAGLALPVIWRCRRIRQPRNECGRLVGHERPLVRWHLTQSLNLVACRN